MMHDKDAPPKQVQVNTNAPWHQVIVEPGEDRDALIAALIASGKAKEGDNFGVIIIVEPIGAGYPKYVLDQWGNA